MFLHGRNCVAVAWLGSCFVWLSVWGVTSPSLDSMNPEPRLVSARTRSRSAWARAADTRLTRLFLLSRHTGAYGDVVELCVRV